LGLLSNAGFVNTGIEKPSDVFSYINSPPVRFSCECAGNAPALQLSTPWSPRLCASPPTEGRSPCATALTPLVPVESHDGLNQLAALSMLGALAVPVRDCLGALQRPNDDCPPQRSDSRRPLPQRVGGAETWGAE